jgi:DNA-binding transcriptional LysR family regulator
MDVDLRKLRYFVAVADYLHFGRAAEELHIAQPVLSRQIRALEHEMSAQLFVRDKRSTELTPAGVQLLADAKPLLTGADALRRRVARAARGVDSFTVGFMPGLIVTAAVRQLSRRHPELAVDVVRTGWDNQVEVIRDGRVDIGYIRLPADQRGLTVEPLLSELRVAVVPVGHRLAGKGHISVRDLVPERMLQDPDAVPEWRDIAAAPGAGAEAGAWTGDAGAEAGTWSRRPSPDFRAPRTVEEKLEHVAAGNGVVVLPLSTAVFYTRPDIVHLTVDDIPPNKVCLAWDSTRRSPLIREFANIALEHGGGMDMGTPAGTPVGTAASTSTGAAPEPEPTPGPAPGPAPEATPEATPESGAGATAG